MVVFGNRGQSVAKRLMPRDTQPEAPKPVRQLLAGTHLAYSAIGGRRVAVGFRLVGGPPV